MKTEDNKHAHLRQLLSSAIPLLCKNGLGLLDNQFAVEAFVGITVNDGEVILVSFKEIITSSGNSISHTWKQCEDGKESGEKCEKNESENYCDLTEDNDLPENDVQVKKEIDVDIIPDEEYQDYDEEQQDMQDTTEWGNNPEGDWFGDGNVQVKDEADADPPYQVDYVGKGKRKLTHRSSNNFVASKQRNLSNRYPQNTNSYEESYDEPMVKTGGSLKFEPQSSFSSGTNFKHRQQSRFSSGYQRQSFGSRKIPISRRPQMKPKLQAHVPIMEGSSNFDNNLPAFDSSNLQQVLIYQ